MPPKTSSFTLNRASAGSAQTVLEKLLPVEDQRRQALSLLADSIEQAHALGADVWGVTLFKDRVRLNAGPAEACVLDRRGLYLVVDDAALKRRERETLRQNGQLTARGRYRSVPEAAGVRLPLTALSHVAPSILQAHARLLQKTAQMQKRTTRHEAHSTGVIAYLREFLGRDLPDPDYVAALRPAAPPEIDVPAMLQQAVQEQGLHFTPWQIATFFTALQVKGFVILSGISGTGKTRLAGQLAALLPQPPGRGRDLPETSITLEIEPAMLKYGRLLLPPRALRLLHPSQPDGRREVLVSFDGKNQMCRLEQSGEQNGAPALQLLLRGAARHWLSQNFAGGGTLLLEPEIDDDQHALNFRLYAGAPPSAAALTPATCAPKNALFIPVRPDWRDSKSLLGFYNPLTSRYEWTPFLRFLARAAQSFRAGDGLAWFVILDEMNLARVEHYFADLLSVLESGRDRDGWTREPLRFPCPPDAGGEVPPPELFLPPNLYLAGTVNIDETTHAFSPKVLDRAFTLELNEVDFSAYPPAPRHTAPLTQAERQALLKSFTRQGRFAQISKPAIAEFVAAHPVVRVHLQTLSAGLQPYNLHFGYRVFDEIAAFGAAAQENRLFDAATSTALDAAVLMKVLPRFNGSRARLEAPLHFFLAWCLNPDAPEGETIGAALHQSGAFDSQSAPNAPACLSHLNFHYPRSAARAAQMLQDLYMQGFAAFGE